MDKMRPTHPGEALREEFLVPLGLSASAPAIELKVSAPRINYIVRERRAITPNAWAPALRQTGHIEAVAPLLDGLQSLGFRLSPPTRQAVRL